MKHIEVRIAFSATAFTHPLTWLRWGDHRAHRVKSLIVYLLFPILYPVLVVANLIAPWVASDSYLDRRIAYDEESRRRSR